MFLQCVQFFTILRCSRKAKMVSSEGISTHCQRYCPWLEMEGTVIFLYSCGMSDLGTTVLGLRMYFSFQFDSGRALIAEATKYSSWRLVFTSTWNQSFWGQHLRFLVTEEPESWYSPVTAARLRDCQAQPDLSMVSCLRANQQLSRLPLAEGSSCKSVLFVLPTFVVGKEKMS